MCIVRAPYLNYANYHVIVWSDENSELDSEISIMNLGKDNSCRYEVKQDLLSMSSRGGQVNAVRRC